MVESAEALGISRLAPHEMDPVRASSRGLGDLVVAALTLRPSSLLVCLGGTATLDGGAGMREVVTTLPVETTVACDVRSPLFGSRGAARVFGHRRALLQKWLRNSSGVVSQCLSCLELLTCQGRVRPGALAQRLQHSVLSSCPAPSWSWTQFNFERAFDERLSL